MTPSKPPSPQHDTKILLPVRMSLPEEQTDTIMNQCHEGTEKYQGGETASHDEKNMH